MNTQYKENFALKYAQNSNWAKSILPFIISLKKELKNKSVIDIGCGTGDLLNVLIDNNINIKSYIGVDKSSSMLKIAKRRFLNHNFICSDAQFVNTVVNNTFDIAISIMMYPLLSSKKALYSCNKSIYKCLSKNGLFILIVPHPCFDPYLNKSSKTSYVGYTKDFFEYIIERLTITNKKLIFKDFHVTLQTLLNSFIDTGFSVKKVHELPYDINIKTEPTHLALVLQRNTSK